MTPHYDDGQVTVFHGRGENVLATLAADSVDLILTDPPYNVSRRNGRDNTTAGRLPRKDGTFRKVRNNFGAWDWDWQPGPFLSEAVRVLRPGGSLIAFTSEFVLADYLTSGLDHRHLSFWRKTNPVPAFTKNYVRAVEMLIWQTKGGKWTFNAGGYTPNVFEVAGVSGFSTVNNGEARVHPTQKPLRLIERLVEIHSNPGDLIVDPFMGSGTTLEAAKKHGRRCIGVELDEEGQDWCGHAVRRIAQGVFDLGGAA